MSSSSSRSRLAPARSQQTIKEFPIRRSRPDRRDPVPDCSSSFATSALIRSQPDRSQLASRSCSARGSSFLVVWFQQTSRSSNQRPSVCHSTFESLRLGRSSQSIASGFLRLWDSLNFKKDREFVGITALFLNEKVNSVIHGFTPVGRANHYMPSLKAGSIVKVDRFDVARCSSMYKITNHPFLICFISLTIIDEVITGAPETNLQSIRLFDNLQVIASTNLELSGILSYCI
ncbi:hypothetical protein F2Q69_00037045 [Brassica cretica]|uniref:Uncharacterized protein n=1 Tax=Brassica cretica TaxID=69181 RepID=A0A8S9SHU5_BRACR|nr:hypothetical protein F2Q69_00037045 [Brassica cretica]